eukprot:SAG11_NODE_7588_length_1124_cov_108.309268_1_plen_38_part_10
MTTEEVVDYDYDGIIYKRLPDDMIIDRQKLYQIGYLQK